MLAVEVGKASHVGRIRRANEDALFVGSRLFVVADGMGGHAAGAIASRTALEVLAGLDRAPVTCDALRSQVVEANRAVVAYGRTHPEGLGLGTTVAGIALIAEDEEEHWAVFHVGDSRVYEVRDSVVRQLTVDHSEVQELISAGLLTLEEAREHPSRHIVTRAIGEWPTPALDLLVVPAVVGQRWLITSDGLTSEVTDDLISAALIGGNSATETAVELVRAALAAGGRDNITVVVVDVLTSMATAEATQSSTLRRSQSEVSS